MICPKCGKDDQHNVLETRKPCGDYILRRRECTCGHRFSSIEIVGLNENSMKAIRRKMKKNCRPREYERMIDLAYRELFGGSTQWRE